MRYDEETTGRFDRTAPVPRRTIHDLMATGVGQSSALRLITTMLAAGFVTAVVLIAAPMEWWILAAPPLCLCSFAAWGIAAKRLYALDVAHESAWRRRVLLTFAKRVALAVGLLSALAGIMGSLWLLLVAAP